MKHLGLRLLLLLLFKVSVLFVYAVFGEFTLVLWLTKREMNRTDMPGQGDGLTKEGGTVVSDGDENGSEVDWVSRKGNSNRIFI